MVTLCEDCGSTTTNRQRLCPVCGEKAGRNTQRYVKPYHRLHEAALRVANAEEDDEYRRAGQLLRESAIAYARTVKRR